MGNGSSEQAKPWCSDGAQKLKEELGVSGGSPPPKKNKDRKNGQVISVYKVDHRSSTEEGFLWVNVTQRMPQQENGPRTQKWRGGQQSFPSR